MSVSASDIAFACELFASIDALTTRKMMGGLTIYSDGQIFAFVNSDGTIYLKAKGDFALKLANDGAQQFTSTNKNGKTVTMGYWTLPDAALDDAQCACELARASLATQ